MSGRARTIDRPLALITLALVGVGFFVFSSAALGLLARGSISVTSIAANHLLFGLLLGSIALVVMSRVPYRIFRTAAPYLFGTALVLTALVFIPGVGITAGGATRWIRVLGFSFQPSEFLKVTTILLAAYYLVEQRARIASPLHGIGVVSLLLALPGTLLLLQPDTDTFVVIVVAVLAMCFAAGMPLKHLLAAFGAGLLLFAGLLFLRPYLYDRVLTFIDPSRDPLGAGYQVQQSLLAIGSGGAFGRGFGQSIQKFGSLPEPVNDSIFAVAGEEFGFAGTVLIVGLFVVFIARGLWLAARTLDMFGALIMLGVVTWIGAQSFVNIGAMLGLLPLSGIPLVFMSQGGTSLLTALASVGILLNISRTAHNPSVKR